jgi:FkbM family methyltransferase
MYIQEYEVSEILLKNNIEVTGVFHIGAHECEELNFYTSCLNVNPENIVWIDALPSKVSQAVARGIPNVHCAVISDSDDQEITFNVSNNAQSSSILEFKTHSSEHPDVVFVDKFTAKTTKIDTFFKEKNLDGSKYNFWNLDIQGAELLALKGAIDNLKYAKVLYLEVNTDELYKNCALIGEIDTFLSTFGFKRVFTHMTQHGWGDAIYILS